ncbi:MAG: hypothetical protein WDZ29_03150 [Balneolaceae bacterium]
MKNAQFLSIFTLLLVWSLSPGTLSAQEFDIDLDIQAEPVLTNSQIIELSNLVFDESGRGPRLLSLFMQNQSESTVGNLYLDLVLSSERVGTIVESYQRNDRPFSLQPGQSVFATNNDIASGRLPGINVDFRFDGQITDAGKNLINELQGTATLPADEYTIDLALYQTNNRRNGGQRVAFTSITIGSQLIEDDISVFLQSPGDVVGSDITISNPNPEFRWEGLQGQAYRVILVEERDGENPESQLQSAKSTSASVVGQTPSLLEFEHADVRVDRTGFQYPTTGVQPLRPGRTYYWQVFTALRTTSGEEERASEIWSFTLMDERGARGQIVEVDQEMRQLLAAILGSSAVEQLERQEYRLEGLEIDDRQFTGEMARDELMRIIELIRDGKARVVNGN